MAIRCSLAGQGNDPLIACCNFGATLGGQWNTQGAYPASSPAPWTNPLSALTALQVAVTVKPFLPLAGPPHIIHQWNDANNSQSTFFIFWYGAGILAFEVINGDSGFKYRSVVTNTGALVAGQWNRILAKWRGSDNAISIWVNGIDKSFTRDGSGTPITAVSNTGTTASNIEVGGMSWQDQGCLPADFAEAAIWGAYGPDTDAVLYGQGYSPNLMTTGNRIRYATLQGIGTPWVEPYGGSTAGTVLDVWSGITYGGSSAVVPWGGIFDAEVAPHPTVITSLTPSGVSARHVNKPARDYAMFPTRGFERYELHGHVGKRSGITHLVPSEKTYATALVDADYGDDIVIDHTATAPVGSFTPPDRFAKAIGPTTPRMPPNGARKLVIGTPLRTFRSSRAPISTVAPTARSRPPSYILTRPDDAVFALLPASRDRTIRMPGGWDERVIHEDAFIGPTHFARMATIKSAGSAPIIVCDGNNPSNLYRWAFRGIQFRQDDSQGQIWASTAPMFQITGAFGAGQGLGPEPREPDHVLFIQCAAVADPLGTGNAFGKVMMWSGRWGGWVSGYASGFHGVH